MGSLLASALLSSCSKDKEEINELIGKWYPTNTKVNGYTIPYGDHETCGKDYLEFKKDNTFKLVDVYQCKEDAVVGTYTISGNNLTLTSGPVSTSGTYTVSGSLLSITSTYDFNGDGKADTVIDNYTR